MHMEQKPQAAAAAAFAGQTAQEKYPLQPRSIGQNTYVIISRGHHDTHAVMAEVRKSWSWPLRVPEHLLLAASEGAHHG